jgi:4,5-dihydroxyphthalate decarboxylase
MNKRRLKIALDRLDRHIPFFMGAVTPPDGYELHPLEVGLFNSESYRDGADRHGRMFRDKEFDICEQSLASYIIAKSRGDTSLTATPVFPRRLFSQNCMFVNVDSGIEKPSDLVGKRVAINSFQTTLCVLAKGDLKFEYGVPWEEIRWFVQREEELQWESGQGISVEMVPEGKDAAQMLVDGELDAYFNPSPPPVVYHRTDRVRRLFEDARVESIRYFNKLGYCPILHIMVLPTELVDREPWLPRAIIDMWGEAKEKTLSYYSDPGYSLLLFARNELEAERDALQADPWISGFASNRANLEQFIRYMVDQQLIEDAISVERLFHESVLDT